MKNVILVLLLLGSFFHNSSFADQATIEKNRHEVINYAIQWAQGYMYAIGRMSYAITNEQRDSLSRDVANIQCRMACLKVVFEEEIFGSYNPRADKCVIVIHQGSWDEWSDVLDKSKMAEGKNDPTDQLPFWQKLYAKPLTWLQGVFDMSEVNAKINAESQRNSAVMKEMTKPCN